MPSRRSPSDGGAPSDAAALDPGRSGSRLPGARRICGAGRTGRRRNAERHAARRRRSRRDGPALGAVLVGRRVGAVRDRARSGRRGRRPRVPARSLALPPGAYRNRQLRGRPRGERAPRPGGGVACPGDPRRPECSAGGSGREPARRPRRPRFDPSGRHLDADRARDLPVPGRDPPRPRDRGREEEPRAHLPADRAARQPAGLAAAARQVALGRERHVAGPRVLMGVVAELQFLTPTAALVALAAIVPLAVLAFADRRAARTRTLLGLPPTGAVARLVVPVAVCAVCGLVAFAAAQPVMRTERPRLSRRDAQAFVALDISRSMLASAALTAPPRIERAKAVADRIRAGLSDVPIGVATFTDRPLPLLFPTTSAGAFTATVAKAVAIEQPPPRAEAQTVTTFDALGPLPATGYFDPSIRHRVLFVVTDAE